MYAVHGWCTSIMHSHVLSTHSRMSSSSLYATSGTDMPIDIAPPVGMYGDGDPAWRRHSIAQ